MIISPKKAIEKGWIKNVSPECVQPNSIDIRLHKLFLIEGKLTLGIKDKQLPTWVEIQPEKKFFHLQKFTPYQFLAYEYVDLPKDVVMRLYFRSTLNRGGVFIGAGWWDSGFSNYVGAAFYPFCDACIEQGARIAQVVFIVAETEYLYKGQYNIEKFNP